MNDSANSEGPALDRAANREQRLQAVKRWATYVRTEPPETWGPQQNSVVDAQVEAALAADHSVEHQQRVRSAGAELAAEFGDE